MEVRLPHGADAITVADGTGHLGTSSDFAVLPAPAARVVFSSPPVDAIAGACAGPVTVALEDRYGAPTFAAAYGPCGRNGVDSSCRGSRTLPNISLLPAW